MQKRIWLLALVAAVMLDGGAAWADFYVIGGGGAVGTKITSLPCVIDKPGFYYLGGNLTFSSTNGTAIIVNADNVTIDLMGFTLFGSGVQYGAYGIYITARKNVEVRNGTITNFGFLALGDDNTEARNHRFLHLRVYANYYGIILMGNGHTIENCTVTDNVSTAFCIYNALIKGNMVRKNGQGLYANNCLVVNNVATDNSTFNLTNAGSNLFDNHIPSP